MYIGLCDDDVIDRKFMKACLERFSSEYDLQFELTEFDSGEKLLEGIENQKFDVLFLDIYMKSMSGMDVAKELRKHNQDVLIVFITSSTDFAVESYRVQAVDYLLKPISYDGISESMQRIMRTLKLDEKYIEILSNRVRTKVKVSTITYAEVFNTVCILHTCNDEYKTYNTLEEINGMLGDERFIRCHRSFLVNLYYIEKIEDRNFILKGDIIVPIGRKNCTEIKKKYYTYLFEQVQND